MCFGDIRTNKPEPVDQSESVDFRETDRYCLDLAEMSCANEMCVCVRGMSQWEDEKNR